MLTEAITLVLGGVLLVAAVAKLASPRTSRAALATFGLQSARGRTVTWAAVIAAEVGLGVGVAAGSDLAAWLAAAMIATFAVALVVAMLRGRAGAPCACFGARSTVSPGAIARNVALAAALAGLPFLPDQRLTTDQWLGLGLGLALLICLGLVIAVLALAREVGMLRLRLGPASALEIPDEGPPLGSRYDRIDRFERDPVAELALGVFTSEGCHVCGGLAPAVASLARDPVLAVRTFEESDDADVWAELAVPGSPYAIAFELDGTVLAKGAFNNLAQLESVLAAAERRRAPGAVVGGAHG